MISRFVQIHDISRFVQTHDIWRKDDPRHHVTYDTTQLTDSLVCVSMSNEIRRTIASLTQVAIVTLSRV